MRSESQLLLTHFDWNLQRLGEAIKQEQSEYFKGAALQRFGHTYDITIKVIRSFAQAKDQPCQTDAECFETAVQNGWMEKLPDVKELANDYQRITRKPQNDAENIYKKLAAYHQAFCNLYTKLKKVI